jgi:regulator of protease activity HflC (stomatin/prohibitin superfamily)
MVTLGVVLGALILLAFLIALSGIRVVQQYERGVIFVLGRLEGAKGPGIFWIWPMVSRMVRVDLRIITMEVPPQEVITRDNVTVKVTAVVYFYVIDPSEAVIQVTDFVRATAQIAQTTLRNVLGQSDLDQILSERETINRSLQAIIDEHTERWGVKVTAVEMKDVELPQSMQRAMAKQAEAEREKRAKIIHAQGEYQASETLAQAAKVMAREPSALHLRYLQTLTEIAVEKNSTIIFPLPLDLLQALAPGLSGKAREAAGAERPAGPAADMSPHLLEEAPATGLFDEARVSLADVRAAEFARRVRSEDQGGE